MNRGARTYIRIPVFREIRRSVAWRRVRHGLALAALLTSVSPATAEETTDLQQTPPTIVERGAPVTPYVVNVDVRDLPAPPQWQPGDPIREIPRRFYPKPGTYHENVYEVGRDPLLDN